MNTEFHAEGFGDQGADRSGAKPRLPRRSLIILVALASLAFYLILLPRSALYYPNVLIGAADSMEMDFLLTPRQSESDCQSVATSVSNVIITSCRDCRVNEVRCLKNPPEDVTSRFGTDPLPVPSARLPDGIVMYKSGEVGTAWFTCQESERQAVAHGEKGKVACYPAGNPRPRTSFEQGMLQTSHNTFILLLGGTGALLASIVIAIFATYWHRKNIPAAQWLTATYPWLDKFVLVAVDALMLLGPFLALAWPATDEVRRWSRIDHNIVITYGIIIILTIGWFWVLLEHYDRRRPFWSELREILRVLFFMLMISGTVAFVTGIETEHSNHLLVWLLSLILLPLGRAGIRQILDDFGLWQRPAVIVGNGENAKETWLAIRCERTMGYRLLGFVKVGAGETGGNTLEIKGEQFSVYGESVLESLPNSIQLFFALDTLSSEENQTILNRLITTHTRLHIIPSLRGLPLLGTRISHFFSHEVLLLTVHNNLSRRSLQWSKRFFDILAASILLVVLAPLLVYVAWRIWREDGSPVIFHQPRVAKGQGEFGFLKFRSMVKDADQILARWRETNSPEWQEYYANNFKLKNDPRILSVGAWIRSTSIDELPQLINVLRGEMSLVGPRPLLARELPDYSESIIFYRQALPGITGLWQISGRSETKFIDRANLDEWYVRNWCLWYDIVILFKTIDVVLNRRGAH